MESISDVTGLLFAWSSLQNVKTFILLCLNLFCTYDYFFTDINKRQKQQQYQNKEYLDVFVGHGAHAGIFRGLRQDQDNMVVDVDVVYNCFSKGCVHVH